MRLRRSWHVHDDEGIADQTLLGDITDAPQAL